MNTVLLQGHGVSSLWTADKNPKQPVTTHLSYLLSHVKSPPRLVNMLNDGSSPQCIRDLRSSLQFGNPQHRTLIDRSLYLGRLIIPFSIMKAECEPGCNVAWNSLMRLRFISASLSAWITLSPPVSAAVCLSLQSQCDFPFEDGWQKEGRSNLRLRFIAPKSVKCFLSFFLWGGFWQKSNVVICKDHDRS